MSRRKMPASTHCHVWIVHRNGTRTDHGIHAKAEAMTLAKRLISENPADLIECKPAGGAPMTDAELDKVFDRVARSKSR